MTTRRPRYRPPIASDPKIAAISGPAGRETARAPAATSRWNQNASGALSRGSARAAADRGGDPVGTILVIIVLVLLFGGGGGYYGYRSYGGRGLGGVLGVIIIVLLVVWLLGGLAGPPVAHV